MDTNKQFSDLIRRQREVLDEVTILQEKIKYLNKIKENRSDELDRISLMILKYQDLFLQA